MSFSCTIAFSLSEMNASTFSFSHFLLLILIALFFFTDIPSSSGQNTDLYKYCGNQFVCGNIRVDFPFWGGGRPSACGIPELELKCEKDITKMNISGVAYRVLAFLNWSSTLRIAREDFLVGLCAPQFMNSTFDPTVFETIPAGYTDITFVYGCMSGDIPDVAPGLFTCRINEVNHQSGYVRIGDFGPGPCYASVFVPVSFAALPSLVSRPDLEGKLKEGFEVKWRVDGPACAECRRSLGVCGFDRTSNQTTCYCPNQPHGSRICAPSVPPLPSDPPTPGSSRVGWEIKVVIGISAAMAAIITFSAILFSRREVLSSGRLMIFRLNNSQRVDRLGKFMMEYHFLTPKRYTYSDIKRITNSFIKVLGHGGFGNVYKGKLSDGRIVAVKVLKHSRGDGEEFMNEVASISRTSHVNIVTLLGFCYERTERALIYEYMPNGSLDKFISYEESLQTNCRLEWKLFYEIAIGIARGLEYLHRGCNTRIVHFDIKPHNILLDADFCPKISDFGLAKLCKDKVSKVSMVGTRGTAGYIAPEVFCRSFGGVSYKSDVYSYGMMVLDMVGERNRFGIGSSDTSEMYFPDRFYKHLEPGEISKLHVDIAEYEEEIVRKMILVGLWCIQTIPSDRPSMTKVVEMFEGGIHSLQIPPRPFLSSPEGSPKKDSSTKSYPACLSMPGDEGKELSLDEGDL